MTQENYGISPHLFRTCILTLKTSPGLSLNQAKALNLALKHNDELTTLRQQLEVFHSIVERAEEDVQNEVDSGSLACRFKNTLLGFISLSKQIQNKESTMTNQELDCTKCKKVKHLNDFQTCDLCTECYNYEKRLGVEEAHGHTWVMDFVDDVCVGSLKDGHFKPEPGTWFTGEALTRIQELLAESVVTVHHKCEPAKPFVNTVGFDLANFGIPTEEVDRCLECIKEKQNDSI